MLTQPLEGRLFLLWMALQLAKVKDSSDLLLLTRYLRDIGAARGADLNEIEAAKLKVYFEWAFAALSRFSLIADDYTSIYELFSLTPHTQLKFMEYWCGAVHKKVWRIRAVKTLLSF